MAKLRFGSPEHCCELDDRTLAHLAVVIVDELRRNDGFPFTFQDEVGATTVWLSLNVPLEFDFDDPAAMGVSINRDWVLALQRAARTAHGLRLVAEPVSSPVTTGSPGGMR
ncbi:hypothetical protein [Microbacterium deminutum]|uniref:DUF7882 family protein n=1 Tax=Microbacterium deminutum TaxID=344164 RepID=UPI0031E3EDA0